MTAGERRMAVEVLESRGRRRQLVRVAWGLAGFLAFTLLVGLLWLLLADCGVVQ